MNPMDTMLAAIAAVTVHLVVHPDDEADWRRAIEARQDLPPIKIHVGGPPVGQAYTWVGDPATTFRMGAR